MPHEPSPEPKPSPGAPPGEVPSPESGLGEVPSPESSPSSAPSPAAPNGPAPPSLDPEHRAALRRVAWESIRHGLEHGRAVEVRPEECAPPLREPGAAFVTLELGGALRGCVGSLEPRRPLVSDVARNAFAAAFQDFRFQPLEAADFPLLDLHVSILTPLVPLDVESRQELFQLLRPGVDGLLLEDPPYRSTFLPQVWDSLKDPEEFLRELLLKAGLPEDHWSPTLRFQRYRVEEI
jgi:uncharacterized protein